MTPETRLNMLARILECFGYHFSPGEKISLQIAIDDLRHRIQPNGFPAVEANPDELEIIRTAANQLTQDGRNALASQVRSAFERAREMKAENASLRLALEKIADSKNHKIDLQGFKVSLSVYAYAVLQPQAPHPAAAEGEAGGRH